MRIAQVVLTKTKKGNWKLTVQSLQQIEEVATFDNDVFTLDELSRLMDVLDWETLSLD